MSWWAIALICLGCLLLGGVLVYVWMLWYLGKSLRG